ncbi:MAG TPA: AAA family ATPase [Anaerolineae bacterium]
MRYLQIQVKGYKSLANVTLDLHPLTVMIGPNGCGKTSLLEVFRVLAEAAQQRLEKAITDLGGLEAVLTHTLQAETKLEIAFTVDHATSQFQGLQTYRCVLQPRPVGYTVSEDNWDLGNEHLGMPRYVGPKPITELRQILSLWNSGSISRLDDIPLTGTAYYSFLNVGARAPVRLPQALTPATQPGVDGETLLSALYNLREAKLSQSIYKRIEETLRLAFPSFEGLKLRVVGAGQITLEWHEKGLTVPLYSSQLSEGTLRFLWLTTVLLSSEPPTLILIDEPEVSLHPELQKILAALLQDASARTQIIVATHSPELIRWLQADEVVVIDKVDGESKFTWASDSSLDLEAWLRDFTLADLWYMGNLGGRP